MPNRQRTVTLGGWNVSVTGIDGGYTLNVHRDIPGRKFPARMVRYGDANGRRFNSADSAFKFALERGYTQVYSRRFWE